MATHGNHGIEGEHMYPQDDSYTAESSQGASTNNTQMAPEMFDPLSTDEDFTNTIDFDRMLNEVILDAFRSISPEREQRSPFTMQTHTPSESQVVDLTDDTDPPAQEVITIESDDEDNSPHAGSSSSHIPNFALPDAPAHLEAPATSIWDLISGWRTDRIHRASGSVGPIRNAIRTRRGASTGRGGIGTDSPEAMRGLLSQYLPPLYQLVQLHHSHHHHHHHPYFSQAEQASTLVEPKYKQPKPAREGYTRDITENMPPPLCTACARPLGMTNTMDEDKAIAADSIILSTLNGHQMHAVRCGHVFCGDCIVAIKAAKKCSLCNRRINKPTEVIECFV